MTRPVSILAAAKQLGKESGWTLNCLQMHRMCYMANMYCIGETGKPLIAEHFEAWHYGPICPKLHHILEKHGSDHIPQETLHAVKPFPKNHPGMKYLNAAVKELPRDHKLNAMVHWRDGAWAKRYKSGNSRCSVT